MTAAPMWLSVHGAITAAAFVARFAHVHAKVLHPAAATHLQSLITKDAQLFDDPSPKTAKCSSLQHLFGRVQHHTHSGGNVFGHPTEVVALCVRMLVGVVMKSRIVDTRPAYDAVFAQ